MPTEPLGGSSRASGTTQPLHGGSRPISGDEDGSLGALLVAVAAEDRAAFAELYARTSGKLYAIVRRILPDGTFAEDAMQEAYVRIWRSAGGYDAARGRPITWMAAIARNLAIDSRRRENVRGGAAGEIDPEALAAPGESPERLGVLARCLDRLAPESRAMILSAYLDGWSREELAERHDRPVGTVKTWLHRGLATLRACLGG